MQIQEYLEKTIKHLGVEDEFEIIIQESDERLKINLVVPSDDAALLIGNRGETLESLELLTKLSFKDAYEHKKIMLDVNDYRASLESKLREKALETARRVLQTGKAQQLFNLNSYERYLIHTAITEEPDLSGVESVSEDIDGERVLLIRVK